MYMYYSRYTNNLQESAVIKANTFHRQQSRSSTRVFPSRGANGYFLCIFGRISENKIKHIIAFSRSLRIHLHLVHLKLNTIFVQQNNLIFNVTIH